jgi:membrane associated rhomboid family serine protease
MNDAAVGHQCPECVAQGRRGQRPARTAFGGSLAGRGGYATRALIAINFLVMIASAVTGGPKAIAGGGGWFGLMGAETPVTVWGEVLGYATYEAGGAAHGVAAGEWWRLVTAMFLHYGALHLFLNMTLLLQLGGYLEDKLGPLRFLALYLLAGLGGNVTAYVLTDQNKAAAGASTAVFGLVAAMIVINRRLRLDISTLVPLLVVNLLFTFSVPHVSITGHLGGLAVGAVVAVILAYAPQPRRSLIQAVGCTAVLLILIVATVLRTQQLLG